MSCVSTDPLCSEATKGVDYGFYNNCISCDNVYHDGGMGVDKVPQLSSKGVDNVCSINHTSSPPQTSGPLPGFNIN